MVPQMIASDFPITRNLDAIGRARQMPNMLSIKEISSRRDCVLFAHTVINLQQIPHKENYNG